MTPTPSPSGALKTLIVKYQALLFVLTMLAIIAAGTRITADLLTSGGAGVGASSSAAPASVRACTSSGTIFADDRRPEVTIQRFKNEVNLVVQERQDLLKNPSPWQCTSTTGREPFMPFLESLGSRLPGWTETYQDTVWGAVRQRPKPVTFASFSSILFELEREEECALSEYERDTVSIIVSGSGATQSRQPLLNVGEYAGPADIHRLSMRQEKEITRIALERTVHALRSFEIAMPVASKLVCLEREYLDLRNEMNLLSDAMSCLPRIWDAATSLHDRAKDSPLNPPSASSAPTTP